MFGDDDPDIAPFFARFLAEGPQRPPPSSLRHSELRPDIDDGRLHHRDRRSRQPRSSARLDPTNGLALGLAGAAAMLEEAAAPQLRELHPERTETFHRLLEDMANDIMQHGPPVHLKPEISPRSRPPSPLLVPLDLVALGFSEPLPRLPQDILPSESDQGELEDASNESSAEDVVDFVAGADVSGASPRYQPTDFGATRPQPFMPSNHIRLSVALNSGKRLESASGKRIFDNVEIDLDSTLEDLFVQVEAKVGKQISTMITRHGWNLERAELPLKWSGLQDGDSITAVLHTHPSVQERKFEVVTASHDSLASSWISKRFPQEDPVSMGAFGDTIAQATGAYPSTQVASTDLSLASHGQGLDAAVQGAEHNYGGLTAGVRLPARWLDGLGGGLDLGLVPPVPPGAEAWDVQEQAKAIPPMPTPPDCMLDEFEDFPADAFITPQHYADGVEGLSEEVSDSVSPSKPRLPRKSAASPPPPTSVALAAATPTSSRLSDLSLAPTPSRRVPGAQGQEETKKRLEEKQKQNDAIWANIAATLEPAQLDTTKRSFLSQTTSAASLGKKLPPMMRRQR